MLTGSAGTGKSAILDQAVKVAAQGVVHAYVRARGLNADRMADLVGQQLVKRGVVTQVTGAHHTAAELIGDLAVRSSAENPPVVVVDGLDEAGSQAPSLIDSLLIPIAHACTVIVSTRDSTPVAPGTQLVAALSAIEKLDLDAPDVQARTRKALHAYIETRLRKSKGKP